MHVCHEEPSVISSVPEVQIGFLQFQTMMSVQLVPTSAVITLTVWTLKDLTSAGASLASEAMASNAQVRPSTASLMNNVRDALVNLVL